MVYQEALLMFSFVPLPTSVDTDVIHMIKWIRPNTVTKTQLLNHQTQSHFSWLLSPWGKN